MKTTFIFMPVLVYMLIACSHSWADSNLFFTGGGIILEGHGKKQLNITFAVNVYNDEYAQPAGFMQTSFHNTTSGVLDKGKFVSKEVTEFYVDQRELGGIENSEYLFVRIRAVGQFDGQDGWTVTARFSDFGIPDHSGKFVPEILNDAVRIQVRDQYDNFVYDTAAEDEYPREQSWRTLLDGGNVTVFNWE